MNEKKSYPRTRCVYTLSVDGRCYTNGGFRRIRTLYEAMQAALDPVPVDFRPVISMAIGEYYTAPGRFEEGGDMIL